MYLLPKRALQYDYISTDVHWYTGEGQRQDAVLRIPVPLSFQEMEDLPSFWWSRPAGDGNDVVHVKQINPRIDGTDGTRWLSPQVYCTCYWYSNVRQTLWYRFIDGRVCIVKAQVAYGYPVLSRAVFYIQYHEAWVVPRYADAEVGHYARYFHQDYQSTYIVEHDHSGTGIVGRWEHRDWPQGEVHDRRRQQIISDVEALVGDTYPIGEAGLRKSDALAEIGQSHLRLSDWTDGWEGRGTVTGLFVTPLSEGKLRDFLLFDELNALTVGYSSERFAIYHIKALMQATFLDALDHVPQLNENSLQNIAELVGFIKALVIDHRIEIPKSLSSAWLAYRYTYSTTKSDVEDAIAFVHRHVDDRLLSQGFSCYGIATQEIEGTTVTARCSIDMKQKELDTLSRIWTALYRYGLSPSFYIVWDTIPYSFVVDWFIPIGDILSAYDKTRMYERTYDYQHIWYSLSYFVVTDNFVGKAYTRFHRDSAPELQGLYMLENIGSPSKRVTGFRILDALSLLFRK